LFWFNFGLILSSSHLFLRGCNWALTHHWIVLWYRFELQLVIYLGFWQKLNWLIILLQLLFINIRSNLVTIIYHLRDCLQISIFLIILEIISHEICNIHQCLWSTYLLNLNYSSRINLLMVILFHLLLLSLILIQLNIWLYNWLLLRNILLSLMIKPILHSQNPKKNENYINKIIFNFYNY